MDFVNFAAGICTVIYVVGGALCGLHIRAADKAQPLEDGHGSLVRWARAMVAPTVLTAVLAWYPWLHLNLGA